MTNCLRYGNEPDITPLHYPECGLEDVYLLSGYQWEETPDGQALVVKDVDGLLRAIGMYLVQDRKVLRGKEIRYLRNHMGLSQAELGALIGRSDQQVARWEKEQSPIQSSADALLRLLYLDFVHPGNVHVRKILDRLRSSDTPAAESDRHYFTEEAGEWMPRAA